MRALMYTGEWQMPLQQVPAPTPGPGEVLVRVRAAGICGSDVHGYTGSTGRRQPGIIMGHEFSGVIEALGTGVTARMVGERVAVQPIMSCGTCPLCRAGRPNLCLHRKGIGWSVNGGYAELVAVPQQNAYPLPEGLPFQLGALAEPLAVALHAVNLTPLQLGDTALVVGAGPIGLLCVLALRLKGAGRILISDLSPRRLDLARQLGADVALNGREGDPVEAVKQLTGSLGADVVLEAVGLSPTVVQSIRATRNGGHVTWVGNSAPTVEVPMQEVVTRGLTVAGSYAFVGEFGRALDLLASGRVDAKRLIEQVAPLDDGPGLMHDLADGSLDAMKVMLEP